MELSYNSNPAPDSCLEWTLVLSDCWINASNGHHHGYHLHTAIMVAAPGLLLQR